VTCRTLRLPLQIPCSGSTTAKLIASGLGGKHAAPPTRARSSAVASRVQDLSCYDEFPTGVDPVANTKMALPSSGMEEQDIRIEAVMSITSDYK